MIDWTRPICSPEGRPLEFIREDVNAQGTPVFLVRLDRHRIGMYFASGASVIPGTPSIRNVGVSRPVDSSSEAALQADDRWGSF